MRSKLFIEVEEQDRRIVCSNKWNVFNFNRIRQQLQQIKLKKLKSDAIKIDGKAIKHIDTAGAWLLLEQKKQWEQAGCTITMDNFSDATRQLFEMVEKKSVSHKKIPLPVLPNTFAQIGRITLDQIKEGQQFLQFIGLLTQEFLRGLFNYKHWRFKPLVHVIDTTGYRALPIIALLSFMIGVVISYQMGNQLRNYGANVFIVNLLGLSILREFGPLITAIMVAGRTGSAFTAELGIMKINQEIDALNTMGVTPAELLLIPRIIGLTITLPLLTVWANIFGILGGMLMARTMLDISFYDFLHRFQHEIPLRSLLIGLGKAPVFALIIASVGCFQGMQVQSNAESLGRLTTRSVVVGIFLIIVADALFSILFSRLNL